jgi:hypothetical protein
MSSVVTVLPSSNRSMFSSTTFSAAGRLREIAQARPPRPRRWSNRRTVCPAAVSVLRVLAVSWPTVMVMFGERFVSGLSHGRSAHGARNGPKRLPPLMVYSRIQCKRAPFPCAVLSLLPTHVAGRSPQARRLRLREVDWCEALCTFCPAKRTHVTRDPAQHASFIRASPEYLKRSALSPALTEYHVKTALASMRVLQTGKVRLHFRNVHR